ncbi:MAG: RCC1 domain-containing protein [Roseiflexaceae bacterium]
MNKTHHMYHLWILVWSISLLWTQAPAHSATNITAISAGTFHTCIIMNGQVWCWGANSGYQLGDGSYFDRLNPVQVRRSDGGFLTGATHLSAAYDHTCAISQKQVWCWGNNIRGQLGNGSTSLGSMTAVRVKKSPRAGGGLLNNATGIATGTSHSCAINAGQAWCWGDNRSGQLGAGTMPNQDGAYRVQINGGGWLPTIKSISSGPAHTCSIASSNGQVWCWGDNFWATLGDGTETQRSRAVRTIKSTRTYLNGMNEVSAGNDFVCATNVKGALWCWGNNLLGQLSTNTLNSAFRGAVQGKWSNRTPISSMKSIDVGYAHGCARYTLYAVCWGYNSEGQLGINSTSMTTYPVTARREDAMGRIIPLTNVTDISAGAWHTCAIVNRSQVWCWGRNSHGQLGDTSTTNRQVAVRVLKSNGSAFP